MVNFLCLFSVESNNVSNAAPVIDMKKIKPRVDTHWSGAVPLRNSMRAATKSTAATATAANAAAAPRLLRSRLTSTATLQGVKYVSSTAGTRAKSPITRQNSGMMRRQESTLNRNSLTKLKSGDKIKAETAISRSKKTVDIAVTKSDATVETTATEKLKIELSSHSQKMIGQVNQNFESKISSQIE